MTYVTETSDASGESREQDWPEECYAAEPNDIITELLAAKIDHVISVPDYVQISLHKKLKETDGLKSVFCATEDEAIAVAVGLHISGHRSVVVIQNQGLFAAVNAIRAAGLDAEMPVFMLVGEFVSI
jgi:sulfopyruvate decarboxylase subunit alpha